MLIVQGLKSQIIQKVFWKQQTKGSKLDSQEKFEDTKGQSEAVNRRRINNTMAKRKRTNNDLQIITWKTKARAIQTPLRNGGELWCFRRVSSSAKGA